MSKVSNFRNLELLFCFFYWGVRFPGVAHSDTAVLIEHMHNGQIVNQWTLPWYFLVQVLTFNGRSLAILSLVQVLVGIFTFRRIGATLNKEFPKVYSALRVLLCSPIFGYLATTVNHDFLAACGTILLFLTFYEAIKTNSSLSKRMLLLSVVLSSFSYISISSFILSAICYSVLVRNLRALIVAALLALVSLINFALPGLTSTGMTGISLVSDIKCAAEDHSHELSERQSRLLSQLAPIHFWKSPQGFSCASSNQVFSELDSRPSTRQLLSLWIGIGGGNPGAFIKAHLMKAGFALPPPFGLKPAEVFNLNSINIDTRKNVEFLLMDRSLAQNEFPFLQVAQNLSDLLSFQINLITGWISWAGLWLVLIILTVIRRFYLAGKPLNSCKLVVISSPLVSSHLFVLATSPLPEARYLLCTILLGMTISLSVLIETTEKYLATK